MIKEVKRLKSELEEKENEIREIRASRSSIDQPSVKELSLNAGRVDTL